MVDKSLDQHSDIQIAAFLANGYVLPRDHDFLEGRYDGQPRFYCKWCGLPEDLARWHQPKKGLTSNG